MIGRWRRGGAAVTAFLGQSAVVGPDGGGCAGRCDALQRAHVERVPFENLDIRPAVPIELDAASFARRSRWADGGGFCYRLNGAFAQLLGELGYPVELLAARVHSPAGLGDAFGHLCLRVQVDGNPQLVDVGFGRGCFDEPIALVTGTPQRDTAGTFELRAAGDGELDMLCDGAEEYRVALTAWSLEDFEPGCRYHQTSPHSPFTGGNVCTLRTPGGRVTIAGTRLLETTGEEREERELDRSAFEDVLVTRFGIDLGDAAIDLLVRTQPASAAAAQSARARGSRRRSRPRPAAAHVHRRPLGPGSRGRAARRRGRRPACAARRGRRRSTPGRSGVPS